MTIIAWDGEVMAADTKALWNNDDVKTENCKKIFKSKGHTFGVAGENCPGNKQIADWFFGERKPFPKAKFTILVVKPDGKGEVWDEAGLCEPVTLPYWAIGASSEAALVGMKLGHSARETMAACIKHCESVGGKVFWKRTG